jgi:PAS domain S-box-containing protein
MNQICNLNFFNYLDDMFFMLDMNGNIIETNDYVQEILNYSKKDIKKNIEDIIPLDGIKDHIFADDIFTSKKIPIMTKKGPRFFIIKSMKVLQKCTNENFILIIVKDIEAEEKYEILFNNSIQGIFQSTLDGRYITVNPAYAKICGYDSPEDLINSIKDIKHEIYANPEDRDRFLKHIFEHDKFKNFEGQLLKKDGSRVWVSVAASSIKDDFGNILYIEGIVEDITEKKESFVNYKSLLDAIPDMMARIRKDYLILDIKPGEGMFSEQGQSDIFIGHKIDDLPFGDNIIKKFKEIITEVINKNVPIIYEYSINLLGKERYYYSRTVKNGDDEVVVIVKDITEETNLSIALMNSKEFAENLMKTANVMIVGLDIKGNVIIFNESAEKLTGYKRNEIIGKNWFTGISILSKEDVLRLREVFDHLIGDKEKDSVVENVIITKEGEIKYILWRNNEIKENGKVTGTISFGLDISERKNYIEEIISSRNNAMKSEKKYRELIETLQEGIWSIDNESTTTYVNDRMCDMLGYKSNEIIGKSLFNFMSEKSVNEAKYYLERRKQGIIEQHDFEFIKKDGTKIYTTLETGPLKNDDGEYIGAIAGIIDISERKKYEEDLIEARNKAEQSDKMKLEFLANMSHDLRTPMNSIIGFSDLLKTNDLTKSEKNDYINTIINNGKFLMALIDDIIDISKIDSKSLKIDNVDFELNKLMEELRLTYSKKIKDKKLEIIIDVDVNKNIIINTDKYRLRQILMNLIGNAVKFTNDGYVKFGYKILNGKQLEIYVEDTGPGIERQNQKIIFERFKQIGNGSNKFKGAGLGLSIAKSLTELLGFREIKLISELEKGSKFYFIVPYTVKPYNYITEVKLLRSQKKMNFTGKKILVVEDNAESRTIIKSYLLPTNATIIEIPDGNKIIEVLKNNHIDLILLDLGLPGKDGYQVLEEIREFDDRLPVIIESALAMPDQKSRAFELGCDDYINKPYSRDDFLNKINNLL